MNHPLNLRLQSYLDAVAAVAMTAAAGILIWGEVASRPPASNTRGRGIVVPVPVERLLLADTPTKGDIRARVAVIEYADFDCSSCAAFATRTLPALEAKYISTGKVLFAFRHRPLTSIHPQALQVAVASECARSQGRFWEMHDALFQGTTGHARAPLEQFARSAGLELNHFQSCMAEFPSQRVNDDLEEANRFGIKATPTLLFGIIGDDGRVTVRAAETGALTPQRAEALIDKLLESQEDVPTLSQFRGRE